MSLELLLLAMEYALADTPSLAVLTVAFLLILPMLGLLLLFHLFLLTSFPAYFSPSGTVSCQSPTDRPTTNSSKLKELWD